ncbi:MAG: hypothetical protein DDT22_01330 [candidate division WS2 bacterium]|nr:hypothetical protein [Candidatus Lithacetigena glycinireducens]
MQEIMQAVSTVGFPIAITVYIIVRLEGVVKENTKATQENNTLIRELKILVERLNGK